MITFELQKFTDGQWKVDSMFDDRNLAVFEARRLDDCKRYTGVRVIEEVYHEDSNLTTTRTVFRGQKAEHGSDLWPHCFVLEGLGDGSELVFRRIGNALATCSDEDLIGRQLSVASANTLTGIAVNYTDETLLKGVPVSRGGEFVKADGTKVLYRSILLPMSDDGETIRGLLGAANCREIVEE